MSAGDRSATLVMMINQIATFFDSQPGQASALHTADHIIAFWSPRMREQLVDFVETTSDVLHPTVREAASIIKSRSGKSIQQALDAIGESSPSRRHGDDAG